MQATNKGSDQSAGMSRLVCAFTGCTLLEISRYGSNGTTGVVLNHMFMYSKTCVKRCHSQKDRKLIFKANYPLMQVKILQNAPRGTFCNTFEHH